MSKGVSISRHQLTSKDAVPQLVRASLVVAHRRSLPQRPKRVGSYEVWLQSPLCRLIWLTVSPQQLSFSRCSMLEVSTWSPECRGSNRLQLAQDLGEPARRGIALNHPCSDVHVPARLTIRRCGRGRLEQHQIDDAGYIVKICLLPFARVRGTHTIQCGFVVNARSEAAQAAVNMVPFFATTSGRDSTCLRYEHLIKTVGCSHTI